MRVSVAMTTYNGESFIKKQLMSIIHQTRMVDEIVIGDDASTDHTISIISECLSKCSIDNNIIINNTNLGLEQNMRNVLKKCSGDIIIFSDQDDLWLPDKVERIITCFNNNTDMRGVLTAFKVIDKNDGLFFKNESDDNVWINIKSDNTYEPIKLTAKSLIQINRGPGCTLAVKREVIDIYLKSESTLIHDWQCGLIAALLNGMYYLPAITTYYRIFNNTIGMNINTKEEVKWHIKLKQMLLSARYYLFFADPIEFSGNILNLGHDTLNKITKACGITTESDDLCTYFKFEEELSKVLKGHKVLAYLAVRHKYRSEFDQQQIALTFEQKCNYTFRHIRLIFEKTKL